MKHAPTKGIAVLFATLTVLFCAQARAEGAFAWTYRYLAVNASTDGELFSALVGFSRTPGARTRENYDVLAQLLIDIAPDERWVSSGPNIAKLLVDGTEAARYHAVLDSVRGKVAAPGPRDEYLRRLRSLASQNAEQYVAGTVDLASLREGYVRAAMAATPTMSQARAVARLPKDTNFNDLFAAAGTPAHVGMFDAKISDVVGVDIRQIWFYYRGIGRVTLDYRHESGWYRRAVIIDPMAFESSMPYRARAEELGLPSAQDLQMAQLLSGNASAIKTSVQAMLDAEVTPLEYLDTAAEVLLRDHAKADIDTVDGYAWICKLLVARGGQRYAGVLKAVKADTRFEKLGRYAGLRFLKGGPPKPKVTFVPGTVSLEVQRTKYPRLYPQITLAVGML